MNRALHGLHGEGDNGSEAPRSPTDSSEAGSRTRSRLETGVNTAMFMSELHGSSRQRESEPREIERM